jgi:hypothetical protein
MMSITLCGFAASNYYNKVKPAFLEKQVPFAEELAIPSKDRLADIPGIPDYLALMYARPHVAAVEAKRQEFVPRFIAAVRKRYGLA